MSAVGERGDGMVPIPSVGRPCAATARVNSAPSSPLPAHMIGVAGCPARTAAAAT